MKVRRYDELLRSRGYKIVEHNKYQGQDIYYKQHKYNEIVCVVRKDSHGKAQDMRFMLTRRWHDRAEFEVYEPFEQFKTIEFDREYLWREANKIHECFEQLKQMKSPKHVYF